MKNVLFPILLLIASCNKEDDGPSLEELSDGGALVSELKESGATDSELKAADIIGTVTDVEGNEYPWVKIGKQRWMAENLQTTKFPNGAALPPLSISDSNLPAFGKMYTIGGAGNGQVSDENPSGVQGVCPDGWHLPSSAEWTQLTITLGEDSSVKLKSNAAEPGDMWVPWAPYMDGNNLTGFAAMPGGKGTWDNTNIQIEEVNFASYFWTSDAQFPYGGHGYFPRVFVIYHNYPNPYYLPSYFSTAHVRCVRDEEL